MDTKRAAEYTLELLDHKKWQKDLRISRRADCYDHVEWMLTGIIEGYILGEKAHRWLAWAQCALYTHQNEGMDTFKEINKRS